MKAAKKLERRIKAWNKDKNGYAQLRAREQKQNEYQSPRRLELYRLSYGLD